MIWPVPELMWSRRTEHARWWLVALPLMAWLVGCGSDDVRPPPAELQPFTPEIRYEQLWSRDVGVGSDGLLLDLRPRVMDGVIYTIDADGLLSAIDAESGKRLWEEDTQRRVSAGLAAAQGLLFFGDPDGVLVAWSIETKQPVWQSILTSEAVVVPVLTEDLVLVLTIDGRISAFGQKDGVRRWDFQSGAEPALTLRGNAVPKVQGGSVIVGLSNGTVIALSTRSGELLWEQRVAVPKGKTELERLVDIDSALLLDEGRLFAVAYQGRLMELDPYDGKPAWAVEASSYSDMALGLRHLFLSSPEGQVQAYDRDGGSRRWSSEALAYRGLGAPVVWGGEVLVADFEGYLHALSQQDGRLVGRFRPGDDAGIRVPPMLVGDHLVVYDNAGSLSAWRRLESGESGRFWRVDDSASRSGRHVRAADR